MMGTFWKYSGVTVIEAEREDRDGQEGYIVKSPACHARWLTCEQFYDAYSHIPGERKWPIHVQQMVAESDELESKLRDLIRFMDGTESKEKTFWHQPEKSSMAAAPRKLLEEQREVMGRYLEILQARIAFTKAQVADDTHSWEAPEYKGEVE